MDDLISRNAVKEEIESLTMVITGLRSGKSVFRDFMNEYKKSVLRIIDEQPTVYNVDKVLEKINEERGQLGFEQMRIDKAIETVKAGGVNG